MGDKRGIIIAIDGPSGVGKTTVSRMVAEKLELRYVNTGNMYRAFALAADRSWVDPENGPMLERFCKEAALDWDEPTESLIVNGMNYHDELRTQKAGTLASIFSAMRQVRDLLVAFQRKIGSAGSIVMEGRDIGTVVFPDADLKIFLDASVDVRAGRRHLELEGRGGGGERDAVSTEIRERDRRDSSRELSPLKMAEDAVRIDTSSLGINEVVKTVLKEAERKGLGKK